MKLLGNTKRMATTGTISEEKSLFIEKLGIFFENYGVSRTLGRVFGYLMISNPPEQSMNDLVKTLGVSKSSVSTSTNSLIQMNIIEKVRIPGERSDRYQIARSMISSIIDEKIKGTVKWREFFSEAINLIEEPTPTKEILAKALAWTEFLDREMPKLRSIFEETYGRM